MTYRTVRDTKPFRPGLMTSHRSLALILNLSWLLAIGVWTGGFFHWQPAPVAAAQGEQEVRPLELGKPIERELAGGESHIYQITLAEGQYLRVIVERHGIDMDVRLLGPDDKQIVEFDSVGWMQEQKGVWQVAEVAGSYRLTMLAKQKIAPAGRYKVRVVELRAATQRDRALQEAMKLNAEFLRLYSLSKYDEARSLAERALRLLEKELGPEHPYVASALGHLAFGHSDESSYAKMELLYQRTLAIREESLGPDHIDIVQSIYDLAFFYSVKGDYTRAEPLFQRALAIEEKGYGPEHPKIALVLTYLARFYRNKGDYAKVEPLLQRALNIKEKADGPEHPNVAHSLTELAFSYSDKGDYAKAELLFQRALTILEKAHGPDHPMVADALGNFAILCSNKGDYVKAEALYQRALTIEEKTFGLEHPKTVYFLNRLASTYRAKGDYAKAELLFQRALAIREKALGPEHLIVITSLRELALFYSAKGDYAKAESLFQHVLTILEKPQGPERPGLDNYLNDLGNLYRAKGDYTKAEPLLQRALNIREKADGPEHLNVAHPLRSLALFYRAKGDYAKAELLFQRALTIREKALGPEHPRVAQALNDLAQLYVVKGEIGQAVNFQSRASALNERNIAINLANSSERQKLAYLATLSSQIDQTISLHIRYATDNPTACSLATTTILQRKGRVLDSMFDSLGALRRRFNPQDQALLDQLKETSAYLARLVLGGSQRMSPAEHQKQIKALEERKENLEAQISRSAEFRAQSQPITIETVQSAIPTNAAVIEFFSYRPFNARHTKPDKAFGQPRYVAYILWQQSEPQWVELGEVKAIDDAVTAWRKALCDPKRADAKRLARVVDEQVMQPVRALLGDTRRVFISPDGALNLIPFAALVDERDQYLVERYSFSYLTSGRDLLRLQERLPSNPDPVIVADPVFGERAGEAPAQRREVGMRTDSQPSVSISLDQLYFPQLPGTAGEAQALKSVLPQAALFTREQATEAALKRLRSPHLLHIATHGFFLEDGKTKLANARDVVLLSDGPTGFDGAQLQNPLLRSGLALAGANLRKSGEDDGVLTAMEVAGLDLWGTKLVVLSACDTGVGEVINGEGVYGLRRALVLAGSETQVMSLWPVSDMGTRDLIIEYYKALQRGEGRAEALRQVQLRMLKRKDRSHPFYWASFIQSGEWANLDGKR